MPALGPCQWHVSDVCQYLQEELEMPQNVVDAFKENAVAGPDLIELSDEDLADLGCKPLQARKIRKALTAMGFKPPADGAPAAAPAPPAPAPAAAVAAAPAAEPAHESSGPPAGYPPAPAGYGAPPPAPGYGAPPPAYGAPPPGYGAPPPGYGAPPPGYGAPPPYYAPAPAAQPAEEKDNHTGRKVAAAVLLTRPRRQMRRVAMARN